MEYKNIAVELLKLLCAGVVGSISTIYIQRLLFPEKAKEMFYKERLVVYQELSKAASELFAYFFYNFHVKDMSLKFRKKAMDFVFLVGSKRLMISKHAADGFGIIGYKHLKVLDIADSTARRKALNAIKDDEIKLFAGLRKELGIDILTKTTERSFITPFESASELWERLSIKGKTEPEKTE